MNWLIWKEYRLNRLIIIIGLLLIIVPHAVAFGVALYGVGPSGARVGVPDPPRMAANFMVSALYSLGLCQFIFCLLGGNIIACERVDQSAEFQAYLPISRARILAGKLILTLMVFAGIWITNLVIMLLALLGLGAAVPGDIYADGLPILGNIVLWGFGWFAVGWLLSSCLNSPTFAIAGSLIAPFIFMMAVASLAWLFDWQNVTTGWIAAAGWVLASIFFVAGSWYYLRRVEP